MTGGDKQAGTKQVIIVRSDLNMRKGKLAAQVAHASVAVFTRSPGARVCVLQASRHGEVIAAELSVPLGGEAHAWLQSSFRKIVVGVDSEEELLELHRQAQAAGLSCALIQDNGATEFHGIPTYTALAIGPHADTRIDPLTRSLSLL